MTPLDYSALADAMADTLVQQRRDFHQHPELAFEEVRTAGIVAQTLTELGLEVQTGVGKTGVVGLLDGDHDGPTVLVRADMDALPIHEATGAPYASTVDGRMHACGHDGHTAIALGVARLLAGQRAALHGRVKFVFQPAEEIAGGARAMIADGVLATPRPDVSLGLHLWNGLPLGHLGVAQGPVMAGSASFRLTVGGKGAHAAVPHASHDPIACAVQLVSAFQTIVGRNVDPFESAVLSVTMIQAGTADNIIPQEAVVRGTIRAFKPEVRALVEQRMFVLCEAIARGMNCTAQLSFYDSTKPVVNDATVTERVLAAIRTLDDATLVLDTTQRTMGAEDMGFLMDDIPGMYLFVGSANSARGLDFGHHHPRFDFDERALPLGVTLLSAAVGAYVFPSVDNTQG